MKNKIFSRLISLFMISFMLITFGSCSQNTKINQGTSQGVGKNASGITIVGSTALQPLVVKAADAYSENNPGITVYVKGGGSIAGLTQVVNGAVDVGDSDIYANEQQGIDTSNLVDHKVCAVGFVLITNKKVNVHNLTKAQIADIFTGRVTNWKQVGGRNIKINIISRPETSGTKAIFKKYVMNGKDEINGVVTKDTSGEIEEVVKNTSGSIGYVALSYITDDVKKDINVLKIDGIDASKGNISTGRYPFWSVEHMYTKGKASETTQAFINYMLSQRVRSIMENLKFVPLRDMKVQR